MQTRVDLDRALACFGTSALVLVALLQLLQQALGLCSPTALR